MVAKYRRNIKSGQQYNHLIAQSNGGYNRRKQFADTDDTIELIKNVVFSTLAQTAQLANALRGKDLKTTCQNVWNFVYWHVQYEKDTPGHEEIRHPARTWADRVQGVDCDDYSVLISSILTNLKIPHALRVTAYQGDWQHIYVVVPKNGNPHGLTQDRRNEYIAIDCVPDHFDFEEKYSRKQDTAMTLNELSGLGNSSPTDGLEGKAQRQARKAARVEKRQTRLADTKLGEDGLKRRTTKVGKFLQKASRGVKKVAASPIRLGWLAAMRLNIFQIAAKLRFAYFTYEKGAQKRGYTRAQYDEIVRQTKKTQNVFVGAGGDSSALKNAILKGRGNGKDPISGLGDLGVAASASIAAILPALKALSAALTAIKPGVRAVQSLRNGGETISEDGENDSEAEQMEGLWGKPKRPIKKAARVEKRAVKKSAKTTQQAAAQQRMEAVKTSLKAKQTAGQTLSPQETRLLKKAEPKKTVKEKIAAVKDKVFGTKETRQANKAKRVEKREAKLMAALKSLQKAIVTQKIRKDDPTADSIRYAQKQYLETLNANQAPYHLTIPEDKLNKLILEAGGETVFESVQAALYLWGLVGKSVTAKRAESAIRYVEKRNIQKDEPYANLVLGMVAQIKKQKAQAPFVFELTEAVQLSGLGGLMGLSGLSGWGNGFAPTPAPAPVRPRFAPTPAVVAPVPTLADPLPVVNKIPDLLSSSDLMNFTYPVYQFDGLFKQLIGNPQANFVIQIWGMPGQGKSTFAMQLSRYLARVHGSVLFVSSEEYPSYTLMEKIKLVGGATAGWDFSKDLSELTAKHKFLVIDSVNHLGWTLEQLKTLKQRRPDLGVVLVMQSTKGGQYKGGQDWGHEADTIVKVEDGKAFTEKNRFQALSSITIF